MTFDVPFHMARRSAEWTSTLVAPSVTGHVGLAPEDDWQNKFMSSQIQRLCIWQRAFRMFRNIILSFVAYCGSPFLVRVMEMLRTEADTSSFLTSAPWKRWIMVHIGFTTPAALTVVMVLGVIKRLQEGFLRLHALSERSRICILTVAYAFTIVCGAATFENLLPYQGNEHLEPPTLAQAEVWGSASFVFTTSGLFVTMAFSFPLRDDITKLNELEDVKKKQESAELCRTVFQ
mmetsp:Transcript_91080/g.260612  ORF Transcript_91080/g.260612 Transcript_91080/m.260612 type:complete len:233 (+) Transcript_91080:3-701(+)